MVGTRGKSLGGFQGLLPGSVSKYCLQHSPVPVIVVRPTSKRDKARSKRANDPDRQGYRDILAKSESLLDVNSPRNSYFANDEEATAVGGHKPTVESHPLAQVAIANDSDDDRGTGTSTLVDDMRSPRSPAVLMKSPHLQNLDSPDLSSEASSSDEEDQGGVSTSTVIPGVEDLSPGLGELDLGSGGAGGRTDSMSYVENLNKAASTQEPSHDTTGQKDSEGN